MGDNFQQAAAAAGLFGIQNMQKMMMPGVGLKRPLPPVTPDQQSLPGLIPPLKRINMLENAAQMCQAAAIQQAQREHIMRNTMAAHHGLSGLGGGYGLGPGSPLMHKGLGHSIDNDPGRMPHRLIEKKRRDRINSCINQLRELLPESIKKATNRPLEKAIVLELSIDYIKQLQEEEEKDSKNKPKGDKCQSSTSKNDPSHQAAAKESEKQVECVSKSALSATYDRGWYDCSVNVTQMIQSGQKLTEIPRQPPKESPFVSRFIDENAAKILAVNVKNGRALSHGSDGYGSDEGRKTSGNLSKDTDGKVVEKAEEKTISEQDIKKEAEESEKTAQVQVKEEVIDIKENLPLSSTPSTQTAPLPSFPVPEQTSGSVTAIANRTIRRTSHQSVHGMRLRSKEPIDSDENSDIDVC